MWQLISLPPFAVVVLDWYGVEHPHLSLSVFGNSSHTLFDYATFHESVRALFPGVCASCFVGRSCREDARVFQRDFPRREWLQRDGVWAAQWLYKVHANWSGERGGLLHGMMLLERRHRQSKKASIRWYQRCDHLRGLAGSGRVLEYAGIPKHLLKYNIGKKYSKQMYAKQCSFINTVIPIFCLKTGKHYVSDEINQSAVFSLISGFFSPQKQLFSEWKIALRLVSWCGCGLAFCPVYAGKYTAGLNPEKD